MASPWLVGFSLLTETITLISHGLLSILLGGASLQGLASSSELPRCPPMSASHLPSKGALTKPGEQALRRRQWW